MRHRLEALILFAALVIPGPSCGDATTSAQPTCDDRELVQLERYLDQVCQGAVDTRRLPLARGWAWHELHASLADVAQTPGPPLEKAQSVVAILVNPGGVSVDGVPLGSPSKLQTHIGRGGKARRPVLLAIHRDAKASEVIAVLEQLDALESRDVRLLFKALPDARQHVAPPSPERVTVKLASYRAAQAEVFAASEGDRLGASANSVMSWDARVAGTVCPSFLVLEKKAGQWLPDERAMRRTEALPNALRQCGCAADIAARVAFATLDCGDPAKRGRPLAKSVTLDRQTKEAISVEADEPWRQTGLRILKAKSKSVWLSLR